ncbi:MAG: TonB-dependent receptor [Planctomycetota bacterium]
MTTRRRRTCLGGLLALLLSPLAPAQEGEGPIALEEEFLFEDSPVVFAASKHEERVEVAPANVQVITADEIERFGCRTVAEALRYVAGVFIDTDLQFDYIGLRGFVIPGDYNTRVLVLLDGHTMNNPGDGSAIGEVLEINVDAIERIEVVKGPGSVLYGTSAFFGAVNIVTKKGASLEGGIVSLEAGRYNYRHGSLAYGRALENGPEFLVSGSYRRTNGEDLEFDEFLEDFGTDTTSQDWFETGHALASVSFGEFSLLAFEGRYKTGIPTADWGATFDSSESYIITQRELLELRWQRELESGHRVDARGFYDTFEWFDVYDYEPASPEFRDEIDARWYGAELGFHLSLAENHSLQLAGETQYVDALNQAYPRDRSEFISTRDSFHIYKISGAHEWAVSERFRLAGGLQYNANSSFDDKVVGRLAALLEPGSRDTLKLIVGQGFRNPSAYEAFYDDGMSIAANPDLTSEEILAYEIAYDRPVAEGWTVSLAAYRNHVRNGIVILPLPSNPDVQSFRNEGDFDTTGFEAGVSGDLGKGVRGLAMFAYQTDSGEDLVNFPSYLASLNLAVPLFASPFSVVVRNAYVGSRLDREGNRTIDSNLMTDLLLRADAWPLEAADFSVGVYNLFDDEMGHAGGDEITPLDVVGPGRTYAARLTVRF